MKWLAFLIFLILTLKYIWDGKDFYNEKEWVRFRLRFVIFYAGVFLLALLTKVFLTIIPIANYASVKDFLLKFSISFLAILSAKLLVLLLCFIFSRIMNLHKIYNKGHYESLSRQANKFSKGLLILAKILVSLGSVIVFYGIWLAH